MRIRDIMTRDVVTVPSATPIIEAERILAAHRFERLPVVDRGELVGLVTKDNILRAGPSAATTLSRGEAVYLLSRLTVAEVMKRNVVTVSPETMVEKAVAIAQTYRVGCLPVVEKAAVVGIVSTNDFFYKVLNPLLGIGQTGARLRISEGAEPKNIQRVLDKISECRLTIGTLWKPSHDAHKNDLIIQFAESDVRRLEEELRASGLEVEKREFNA